MLLLLIAAVLVIGFALFSHIYSRSWDKDLAFGLSPLKSEVFEGERDEITETITNPKLIPLLFGDISFRAPSSFSFGGGKSNGKAYNVYQESCISLFSYEQLTRRLPFTALRRGCYTIDDAGIATDDLFFRHRYIRRFPAECSITVFPRIKGVENFPIDFRRLTGEIISRRSMIEDPFFFRGIRDWEPTDSIRHINWNATARTGSLKVNQYDSTHSQNVLLMLDFDGYNKFDHDELREDMIRIAAYLAGKLLKSGIPTGLITNALSAGGTTQVKAACKNGHRHYLTLLHQMASIDTGRLSGPFCELLSSFTGEHMDSQCILISYYGGKDLDRQVLRLSASQTGISWILLRDKSRRYDYQPQSQAYICEVEY